MGYNIKDILANRVSTRRKDWNCGCIVDFRASCRNWLSISFTLNNSWTLSSAQSNSCFLFKSFFMQLSAILIARVVVWAISTCSTRSLVSLPLADFDRPPRTSGLICMHSHCIFSGFRCLLLTFFITYVSWVFDHIWLQFFWQLCITQTDDKFASNEIILCREFIVFW